jgi:DnaJ domain
MAAAQSQIDYYEVLGVSATATVDEIRTAYRTRISQYHPDRNSSKNATAVAVLLNEAWEKLGDPECKRRYDSEMGFGSASGRRDQRRSTGDRSSTVPPTGAPPIDPPPDNPRRPKDPPLNGPSRPVAAAREPVSSQQLPSQRNSVWSIRVLGLLMIGAGVVCAVLSRPRGVPPNDTEVLLFWLCVFSAIYCFRRSGLSTRWIGVPLAFCAGAFGMLWAIRQTGVKQTQIGKMSFDSLLAVVVSLAVVVFVVLGTAILVFDTAHVGTVAMVSSVIVGGTYAIINRRQASKASFAWMCPQCGHQVPPSIGTCQCGQPRSAALRESAPR